MRLQERWALVLETWQQRVEEQKLKQARAAARYQRCHYLVGIPAVAFAGISGASGLAGLTGMSVTIGVIAGFCGLATSVLTGIQTFATFGERAEKHRLTSARCQSLLAHIESLKAFPPKNVVEGKATLQIAAKIYEDINKEAPVVLGVMEPLPPDFDIRAHLRDIAANVDPVGMLGEALWGITIVLYPETENDDAK